MTDMASPERTPAAHAQEQDALLASLSTTLRGLSSEEAARRLRTDGPNQLPSTPPTPAWQRLLRQFRSLFIYVLIGSALLSYALGHLVDAGVILAVVVINGLIGFVQEGKAEEALNAILSMSTTHCLTLRDGELHSVPSEALVPGDIVALQAGDRVPADLRLVQCNALAVDESALTGESQASAKSLGRVPEDCPLAERHNMVFMGTMLVAGAARGVVTHTGSSTQIGKINTLVASVPLQATPLQKQLAALARNLTLWVLVLCACVVAYGMGVHHYAFGDMLQSAIAIAVAAIPEELPAIVTIVLAIGVMRMARHSALVRRLPAVEVLGSVDIICTDKTGTLTANAMTVRSLVVAGARFQVGGEGYDPVGQIEGDTAPWSAVLDEAALVGALCNDAGISQQADGHWQVNGDPTEGALWVLARKRTPDMARVAARYPRRDALPFDPEKRYMVTLHDGPRDTQVMALKGAPEALLPLCPLQLTREGAQPLNGAYWQEQTQALAAQGMRVIALARAHPSPSDTPLRHEALPRTLTLLALVGISDPPRAEAVAAIADCYRAGIRVKMITGDNPVTAQAIGRELGFASDTVLTGQELDALSPEALACAADEVDIYARTSPANKLQLVAALQGRRHVVAMTGDGVNDAPALRRADIGVAMGMKGTDAAREAADIVLTDDNFATIASAVTVGRTVYDNTLKSILFMLPTNLAEAGIVLLAILFGWSLPITAPQILWINMVTTVTLSLALALEMTERDTMSHPPRPYGQGLITPLYCGACCWSGPVGRAWFLRCFCGCWNTATRWNMRARWRSTR